MNIKPLVRERIEAIKASDKYPTVITHKNCMDGTGSVLAVADVLQCLPSQLNVKFVQYGDNLSEILNTKFGNVIMADFSFSKEELLQLDKNSKNLIVIDHHKTAEQALADLPFTHFDMNESGATLTFLVLNEVIQSQDPEVPELLRYIKDRDLWLWKEDESKEVSAGLSIVDRGDLDDMLLSYMDNCTPLIEAGSAILKYQNQQVSKAAYPYENNKPAGYIDYKGQKIPFMNATTLISEIGSALSGNYPFVIMYFITPDSIVLSFRSSDDSKDVTDVSEIAESFGGGGHPRSSGCSFKFNEHPGILDKLFIDKVLS